MRACARCGTPNQEGAKVCVACGLALEGGPQPAMKQTMLGMAATPAPPVPSAPPPATQKVGLGGTMLGMSPFAAAAPAPKPEAAAPGPSSADTPAEPAPKKMGLQRTMLGFGPGLSPAAQPAPAQAPSPEQNQRSPYHTQPGYAAPVPASLASNGFGSTMPVVQGPGQTAVVPAIQAPPQPAAFQPPAAPAPAPQAPAAKPSLGEKRTMLGVALPGIAPLHPGEPAPVVVDPLDPPPTPRGPSSHPPAKTSSAPPPPTYDQPPSRRARVPKSAVALISAAVLLAVVGIVVAVLWESPRAVTAEVDVDDRGNEVLALTCKECPDGVTVSLDSSTTTFAGHRARLALAKPLQLGQNHLKLETKRPGSSKVDDVSISVSLDYRVNGDLSGLAGEQPNAKVVAEAAQGAAVVVDGHALTLDASGRAEYAFDISHDIEGPADNVSTFEKRLPYSVTPRGGAPHAGQVTLKFGIVPLRVDAPGLAIVIDGENFMLAGRTLKDGRITVSGRPITVDGSGRFAQLMNISAEGETTISVRADAKDYAPRVVHVRVKRVAHLSEEGARFRETAADEYSSIGNADTKKGFSVALDGEVVEARLDGDVTVLLLDVKRGCGAPPCLARVVYGGRFDIARGANVSAYGQVLRAVDGPRTGAKIPEVTALFLVRGRGKAR